MNKYVTLVDTLKNLREQGYTQDLNVRGDCLVCGSAGPLPPEDFRIDQVFRFEGATNPDDQAVLYAISSERFGVKGTLVNGYGISADEGTNALVARLRTHPGHE